MRIVVLAVGFPVLAVGLPLLAVGLLDPGLMELPLRSVPGVPAFMGAMLGLASFWAFWATGLEYHVTADEVIRRSRFGTRSIRWDQLSELRYRGERRRFYLIPVGTYVTLWLRDVAGEKVTVSGGGNALGYLIACPTGVKQLQDEVLRRAHVPLLERLRSHFYAGEDLSLGPLRLSQAAGLRFKTLLGERQIALADVEKVGLHEGFMYLYRRNAAKSETPIRISAVPNCFALLSLLEGLGTQRVGMQAGFVGPHVAAHHPETSR